MKQAFRCGRASSRALGRVAAGAAVALFLAGGGAAIGIGSSIPARHRVFDGGWAASGRPATLSITGSAVTAPAPLLPVTPAPATTAAPAGATVLTDPAPASSAGSPAGTAPGPTGAAVATANPGRAGSAPAPGSTAPASEAGPGATGTAVGAGMPAVGAYTYDTSGGQQAGLLASSSYPSRTSVTVTHDGCGVSLTWAPTPGNSDTVVECPVPGGVRVMSESLTMSVQGYSTTEAFGCDPDAFIPVGSGQPGQTWSWSCRTSSGETSRQVVDLLGPQTTVVGGVPVDVEDVSVTSALSGSVQGTMSRDYWLTSNATPVKETGRADLSASMFGYHSNYSLQLVSLTPGS